MPQPIRTMRQAARKGLYLRITCRRCSHAVLFAARDLAFYYKRDFGLDAMPFRCSKCGVKDFAVDVTELDWPGQPEFVWMLAARKRKGSGDGL